jgi:TonB family protein
LTRNGAVSTTSSGKDEAVLDRAGRVSHVQVVKSVPLLDSAAIAALRQWQYTPSTLHGVPVEVLMTIAVTFTLQE